MQLPKVVIVTSNLIEKDGKFLLVQEGHKYAYGLWNLPAGRLEMPMALRDNAIKEAKEETGLKVKANELVGVYQKIAKGRTVVFFVFASSVVGGKLRTDYPDGELLRARWFSYDELKRMKNKLRDKYFLKAVDAYRKKEFIVIGKS